MKPLRNGGTERFSLVESDSDLGAFWVRIKREKEEQPRHHERHLDKTETTTTRTTHHSPTRERIRHHLLDKPTTKTTNPSPVKTGSKAGLVVGS